MIPSTPKKNTYNSYSSETYDSKASSSLAPLDFCWLAFNHHKPKNRKKEEELPASAFPSSIIIPSSFRRHIINPKCMHYVSVCIFITTTRAIINILCTLPFQEPGSLSHRRLISTMEQTGSKRQTSGEWSGKWGVRGWLGWSGTFPSSHLFAPFKRKHTLNTQNETKTKTPKEKPSRQAASKRWGKLQKTCKKLLQVTFIFIKATRKKKTERQVSRAKKIFEGRRRRGRALLSQHVTHKVIS